MFYYDGITLKRKTDFSSCMFWFSVCENDSHGVLIGSNL